VSSVLRARQHSIGYMGDGFYRSNDPTNSIKVLNIQHNHHRHWKQEIQRQLEAGSYGVDSRYLLN